MVLLAAACTSTTAGSGSQAPTTGTGSGTATSAGATPTSPGPTPPPLAALPVRAVRGCERVTCLATAVVANARPGIHVAVVRGPDSGDAVQQTAYLLSVDTAGRALDSIRLAAGDVFFDAALPRPSCDTLVHCFVVAGEGAHAGVLNVVAVGVAGELTDASQDGALSTDTPDIQARDLDGDGVAELLAVLNNYLPNYAEGTDFWVVWTWQAGRYTQSGCRKVLPGEKVPGGAVSPSSCPS
jgi:hypothetical protein